MSAEDSTKASEPTCDNPVTRDLSDQVTEIATAALAVQSALADRYSDEISAFANWVAELNRKIEKWRDRNREGLRQANLFVSFILENLPEWKENLQANTLLLERGLYALETTGHKSAGYVLSLYETLEFSNRSAADIEAYLYAKTSTLEFADAMLGIYRSTELPAERTSLIDEALTLHRDGKFGGAVTLLYSQLEGILTDAVVELGHARTKGRHVLSPNGNTLRGLHDKLTLAKDHLSDMSDVFSDLLRTALIASDPNSTVSKSRNGVLHGQDLGFATQTRSTKIVLWVCATLIELRAVLPNKSCAPSQRNNQTHE